jgi:hypothetical protein
MRERYAAVTIVAALVLVGFLGALRLFDPFSGDQALFLVGARAMHAGGVLYRDFWDIKQPGIFLFYLAGGLAFGFTQTGIHAADLAWQLLFAIALILGLRAALDDRRWAAFAPVAVVGAYFTGSSPWHLLQVEALAGLPLFCLGWFALEAFARPAYRRRLAALSGCAAGIAILLKLLFVGIAFAIVLTIAASAVRRSGRDAVAAFARDFCLGFAAPLLAFSCYAAYDGILAQVVQTFFALPLTLATTAERAPLARLTDSAMRFLLYYRGIIFLALVGLALVRDERSRMWRRIALVWLVVAAPTILVQEQSWWQYHFALFIPPVGIYATFGLAALAHRVRSSGYAGFAWLGLCGVASYIAVPLPQAGIAAAMAIAAQKPYASAKALDEYRIAESAEYAQARTDANVLSGWQGRDSDGVYVFGNPLIYVLSDRLQAVGINGWALQLYTPGLWSALDRELRTHLPARVFVGNEERALISARSTPTEALLAANYVPATATPDGTWLRRR